ncbi:MAG: cytoplasmic iron level regulating protein YaaA (DUF328/UPF0246 family) [Cyclobacteriaceae bacterium]|jgi:cytoplasmic iron level regulating protein YaaA (DUF328/UPF0246 family)
MITVISPAKTLDFEAQVSFDSTQPRLKRFANELMTDLKKLEPAEVKSLMSISDALAELNVDRYQSFRKAHNESNSKQAMFALKGDVYIGLAAESLDPSAITFAQDHLRILSGLYGLLRPLDLIQPYRLEMGTKLQTSKGKNLYEFWDEEITKLLLRDLKAQGDQVIVNLASQEYFKSIKRNHKKLQIMDVEFLDFHQGEFKMISFFAKKARGLMSRFILQNGLNKPNDLMEFNYEGYLIDEKRSKENTLVFTRQKPS